MTAFGGNCLYRQGNLENVINISDKNGLNDLLLISRRQKIFVTYWLSTWDLLVKHTNSQDGSASKFCCNLLHKAPVKYNLHLSSPRRQL